MLEVADPEIKYLIIFVKNDRKESLINYSLAVIRDSSSFNNEGEAVGGNDSESDGSSEGRGE